jgi:hypothetical protein
VLDDFELDEGHFNWNYNFSPVSQTFGLASGPANSAGPSDRVITEHQGLGTGSQLLNLTATVEDPLDPAWQLRHNSGIGVAAQPAGNVPLAPTGYVGFWLKTDNPDVGTVVLAIDDPVPSGATAIEKGTPIPIIADNQWHLYQWNFEDDDHWEPFNAGTNGAIDAVNGTITIDSIWFTGAGDAQIYLDTVSHNPLGLLAAYIPGDYDRNGLVEQADRAVWQAAFGATVSPGASADGNGDGVIDVSDWLLWRKAMSQPAAGSAGAPGGAIPEPCTLLLLLTAAAAAFILHPIKRH